MTQTPLKNLTFEQYLTYLLVTDGRYQPTLFIGNQQIISRTFPELTLTASQVLSA
ncbi:MAG TPA: hypothetical protein V6D14_34915 [Coleofasciculaceae cyanobacterium]|jgi:Uma2 family endonuclease